MTNTNNRFRYRLGILLSVLAMLATLHGSALAAIYNVTYSGTFIHILDPSGNPGGSFITSAGISIGDTFSGSFLFNTDDAVIDEYDPPIAAQYDFEIVSQSLEINGIDVPLKPRLGLGVWNDIDLAWHDFDPWPFYRTGARESGLDPIPPSLDALSFSTDVDGFNPDANTFFEIIFHMFDSDGSSLSTVDIPNPMEPLNHPFFIYSESALIDGATQATGLGLTESVVITSVPLPTTMLLLGSGLMGLAGLRRKNKR